MESWNSCTNKNSAILTMLMDIWSIFFFTKKIAFIFLWWIFLLTQTNLFLWHFSRFISELTQKHHHPNVPSVLLFCKHECLPFATMSRLCLETSHSIAYGISLINDSHRWNRIILFSWTLWRDVAAALMLTLFLCAPKINLTHQSNN